MINIKRKAPFLIWFAFFVVVISIRVFIDIILNEFYYIPYKDLIFYFLSFVIIPFIALSKVDYTKIDFEKLYLVFLISAIGFGLFSTWSYARFIGEVSRLSTSRAGEEVISPLILSYSATLSLGIVAIYLIKNKPPFIYKLLSYIAIISSITPFFLGASRGSIFALALPFLFVVKESLSFKNTLKYTFLIVIIIILISFLDGYLQSGLMSRFLGIGADIETGSSSTVRLEIWKQSFSQFAEFPLFGDKLNTTNVNFHPHNIFIEVLQSTGIIGFTPFIILIILGLKAASNIFKCSPQYAWLSVIFLQTLMKNLFSGSVFTTAWLWAGLAIVLSIDYSIKKPIFVVT